MFKHKTRVIKVGAFWRVQLWHCGVAWITLRDLHLTRSAARSAAYIEAIN